MEKKKREIKPKIPKTATLHLRLIPHRPKPEPDGRWKFRVTVDGAGAPYFFVTAPTSKAAKSALADYVYNELEGREDIEVDA